MKFYWDYENQELYEMATGGTLIQARSWILRDWLNVSVFTMTGAGDPIVYTVADLPAGYSILFNAKLATALTAAPALVAQGVWTRSADGQYDAVVRLDSEALIAAVPASSPVSLIGEFTLIDADGNDHYSSQFNLTIKPDVHRAADDAGSLTYPIQTSLLRQEVIDGKRYLILCDSDGVEYQRWEQPGV